ncbi:MAG: chromosome segregation protein SMC [Christensenellales bacterium]
MRLSEVEIYGFKSFAQHTQVHFDKGITGIVGPNGSGKSNIADAVRWVLGEQSAKTLRGAKMEDVIFSGTQSRKPLPYCEVSLLFDNQDQSLHSPFTQVLVSRRVYRNGEGEYFLNKTACRLKDVLELFRDTGIGKEGYSIIGQGRIEEILSTKGEERRQVFEEAAGIVTYRVRKEEAERKLLKTVENLNRVGDLLEELESRLEPLKKQASAAQAYLLLAERLKVQEINVFLIRSDRLRERLTGMKGLIDGLRESLCDHEKQLESLSSEKAGLEQALEAVDADDRQARADETAAQEKLHAAQMELDRQGSRLEALQQALAGSQARQAAASEQQSQLEGLLASGEDEAANQAGRAKQSQAAMDREEAAMRGLQTAAEEAERRLDEHKLLIVSALNRLSDAKSQQARQQAMLGQMALRLEELADQKNTLMAACTQGEEQVAAAEAALLDTQEELEGLHKDCLALETQYEQGTAALEKQAQSAQELARDTHVAKSRLQLLEEMARDYEGYNQAVKRALQFAKDDPKVHGVVAKLLRVPQAYETAIDMILGGTLQHIVTQDEETAKLLIDHLRSNKLGRTTFLPLTSIRSRLLNREESALLGGEGCLGVASELVAYDGQYRGIVENILGRTVIVRDLDVAITLSRKARQAFTVVTLAGDVMRAGGAMTGGTAQGKASSLLGREREILTLRGLISQNEAAILEAQRRRMAAQASHAALQRRLQEAREALSQAQIALARDQERSLNAGESLHAGRARLRAVEEAQEQLRLSTAEIKDDLQGMTQETQSVSLDKQHMEETTLSLQQALQTARRAAENQRETLSAMQVRHREQVHQADMLLHDRQRWEKELREVSRDVSLALQEREKILADILVTRTLQSQTAQLLSACQEQLLLCQSRSQAAAAHRGALQQKSRVCADQREKLHSFHQQDSDKLHRSELVYARTESELQSLGEHILNSYDLTYAGAEAQRLDGKFDLPGAEMEIKEIKAKMRELGNVNLGAVEEYAKTKERFDNLTLQHSDAQRAQEDLQRLIDQLLGQMAHQFVQEFEKLNRFFGQTFSRLFGGGQAELILSDKSAPLTCDIDVAAQPPGKKLQLLSLLSGGERALTAIAILFAMLKLKPTPFCILDEIEAALDEANIGHFADYLCEYALSTQFVVITHRKGTMERCDALYGVAMEEKGVSGMVSVDLERFN